jgi:triosephosphate isomerase
MYSVLRIEPPFFEIGPKAYLYGGALLKLARHADKLSVQYDVRIIFTPQCVDIPLLAGATKHILVFAQHMDSLRVGRGIGSVLPEAIKEAGAIGTMLNHAEKKLSMAEIERTIQRADEVGLATLVCADDAEEAVQIAKMGPNVILAETPSSIGSGRPGSNTREIQRVNQLVAQIDPNIQVLHGGGISTANDVYNVIKSGADATGCTSGVVLAENPLNKLEEMIGAMRKAWDEIHRNGE